jgi:hypothetical protein
MNVLILLFIIALIGAAAGLLIKLVPMPPLIQTAILIVALIAIALIAMRAFGVSLPNMRLN